MQCYEVERVLEQKQAEELPPAAAAHVEECERCRALVADLTAILSVAQEFAAEPVEAPERVWANVRAQLESEGLIREPREAGWLADWFAGFPRPLAAGAYLAFLVAAGVLLGLQAPRALQQPVPLVAAEAQAAPAALDTALTAVQRRAAPAVSRMDPAVSASFRQSLDIVDNAIALCEKSVHEDPQNQMAREYLYGAYQQKAELLTAMMDRGARGDE